MKNLELIAPTVRQWQVIKRAFANQTNAEIGKNLGIREFTAKTHKQNFKSFYDCKEEIISVSECEGEFALEIVSRVRFFPKEGFTHGQTEIKFREW